MKITVICPTRQRPEMAQSMLQTLRSTATGDIEVMLYLDKDDPTDYSEWPEITKLVDSITVGDETDMGRAQNLLFAKSSGSIIMPANDDQEFVTKGWDMVLKKKVSQYPDEIYLAWFNDGYHGAKFAAFPIVSRKWCETLGYFMPEGFHFLHRDGWLFDIGARVNRLLYIPEILVVHNHVTFGKGMADETYIRPRRDVLKRESDKVKLQQGQAERDGAVQKLKSLIKGGR